MEVEPALEALARRLPGRTIGIAARAHRLSRPRFWRAVARWRSFLSESERWPEDRLAEWQLERLQELVAHALEHVPHYRESLRAAGVDRGDPRQLADVRYLPLLTKSDLQERLDRMLADDVAPQRRAYATTGGSTGTPVGFYFDQPETVIAEVAFMTTLWSRVGYHDGDRNVVLRGETVAGDRLWRTRPFDAQLRMSSYHLTDDVLPRYLARLRRFRPRYIQGYPSSLDLVASFMLERGEAQLSGLHAVLCGSENVYDWQRERIERAFGARAFSWYGQSEGVCLAGECEHDPSLHIFPEYGYTELIDDDGEPVRRAGVPGEIVATAFHRRAMPLLRYRTGDVAVFADGPCPHCGRAYPRLERVEGRLHEFIVSASGRPVSMTAINMHSPVFDNVRQFRFYQDTPGKVLLRLVPKASYRGRADEAHIRSELAPKLGSDIELVAIEVVEEIPPSASGKHRFLDQRLDLQVGSS